MSKSTLPGHMDSVRQKWRPKHHLLVLKCYPRFAKNNNNLDAKPNGSELSYLLFYASTRSSKLQKVGSFLEKKTATDVTRDQSPRVHVTLQILTALLDKVAGFDSAFVIIAPYVLRILLDVLTKSSDVGLFDATCETWSSLCKNQDPATLAADSTYRELFESVVQRYTSLASNDVVKHLGKNVVAVHEGISLRETGLTALKSLLSSSNVGLESDSRLLDLIMPAVLGNLRCEQTEYLDYLLSQSKRGEDKTKDDDGSRAASRAANGQTGAPDESHDEVDAQAATTSVEGADVIAEENVSLLALDCLKATFTTQNRSQLRQASLNFLTYVGRIVRKGPYTFEEQKTEVPPVKESWAIRVFKMILTWTPVQDRFVLLVTAVELIVRIPLRDTGLRHHLLYTNMVEHILRSELNLIGLSVMDILLGLIQQTLQVLQLSSTPEAPAENLERSVSTLSNRPTSEACSHLSSRLEACVVALATHVYYTDQISDMVSAILIRLKSNPAAEGGPIALSLTPPAFEESKAALREVMTNASLITRERSKSVIGSVHYATDAAHQTALQMVKGIIVACNSSQTLASGGVAENRTRISMSVWDGTQWLLQSPNGAVRRAYVDAIITWVANETTHSDLVLHEVKPLAKSTPDLGVRRVNSTVSTIDTSPGKTTSSFLTLLHLAGYENALQWASSSEVEISLLHTLFASLVRHLGINAVRCGLPMIFTLQEDIDRVDSNIAKIRIGSLVHGYLWSIVEVFDLDGQSVGKEVVEEVARRKSHQLWVKGVTYPPSLDGDISASERKLHSSKSDGDHVASRKLYPFDRRRRFVDTIAEHFGFTIRSTPSSPPASPGRRSNDGLPQGGEKSEAQLLRDELLVPWTKEECLAKLSAEAPRSSSLSGSQSSPSNALSTGNHRQLLASANTGPFTRNGSVSATNRNSGNRVNSQSSDHRLSATDNEGSNRRNENHRASIRVDDLKRVLSTGGHSNVNANNHKPSLGGRLYTMDDNASDSMVEIDEEDFEDALSFDDALQSPANANSGSDYVTSSKPDGPTRNKSHGALAGRKKHNVGALLGQIGSDEDTKISTMESPPY